MRIILFIVLMASNPVNSKDWDDAYKKFKTVVNFTDKVSLTWEQADNILEACSTEAHRRNVSLPSTKLEACSFWGEWLGSKWCHIITQRSLNLATLGHEVRHCFQGNWH